MFLCVLKAKKGDTVFTKKQQNREQNSNYSQSYSAYNQPTDNWLKKALQKEAIFLHEWKVLF